MKIPRKSVALCDNLKHGLKKERKTLYRGDVCVCLFVLSWKECISYEGCMHKIHHIVIHVSKAEVFLK